MATCQYVLGSNGFSWWGNHPLEARFVLRSEISAANICVSQTTSNNLRRGLCYRGQVRKIYDLPVLFLSGNSRLGVRHQELVEEMNAE